MPEDRACPVTTGLTGPSQPCSLDSEGASEWTHQHAQLGHSSGSQNTGCAGGPPGRPRGRDLDWRAPLDEPALVWQPRPAPAHRGRPCSKCSGPSMEPRPPGVWAPSPSWKQAQRSVPSTAATNQGSRCPLHMAPTWVRAPSSLGSQLPPSTPHDLRHWRGEAGVVLGERPIYPNV